MEPADKYHINLLGDAEQALRLTRLKELMRQAGIRQGLVRNNANIYYLTGRVFRGYVYVNTELDSPRYFVRQPNHLISPDHSLLHRIRKPEEIPGLLAQGGIDTSAPIALELDAVNYAEACRLAALLPLPPFAGALQRGEWTCLS